MVLCGYKFRRPGASLDSLSSCMKDGRWEGWLRLMVLRRRKAHYRSARNQSMNDLRAGQGRAGQQHVHCCAADICNILDAAFRFLYI